MKVGFTGTREGLTGAQGSRLRGMFWDLYFGARERTFHHGTCVGADEQAVLLLRDMSIPCEDPGDPENDDVVGHCPTPYTVAHLPDNFALVSGVALGHSDITTKPQPYLERNRNIVNRIEVLIACPKGPEEQRSGTWATVRYARKQGKRIVIIWPNGTVTEEAPAAPAATPADPPG